MERLEETRGTVTDEDRTGGRRSGRCLNRIVGRSKLRYYRKSHCITPWPVVVCGGCTQVPTIMLDTQPPSIYNCMPIEGRELMANVDRIIMISASRPSVFREAVPPQVNIMVGHSLQ